MNSKRDSIPKLCRHKGKDLAYVRLSGQTVYLGRWKSAKSRAEYDALISRWTAAGRKLPTDDDQITIAEMVVAFRNHAKTYYAGPDGIVKQAARNIDESLRWVVKLYGLTPVTEFGPLRLKAVRDAMVKAGIVRTNINRHISRIKSVFKWAVSAELIKADETYQALAVLPGLRIGKGGAQESEKVRPVPQADIDAVALAVTPQVAAMIRLQVLTGMRPGELCIMRGCDLDTTGRLWTYTPSKHKTEHHGHDRTIYLGARAQVILKPFLKTDLTAYLFAPTDSEASRLARRSELRVTPRHAGNKPGSNRRRKPKRTPGTAYTVASYRRAIAYGCDKAFPPLPELLDDDRAKELRAWRKAHRWHPHRLRHTAATTIRKDFGLEGAKVVLGQRTTQAAEIYAEQSAELAKKIARAIG